MLFHASHVPYIFRSFILLFVEVLINGRREERKFSIDKGLSISSGMIEMLAVFVNVGMLKKDHFLFIFKYSCI